MTLDLEALRARVLRPARPQLERAREALAGVQGPREALELAAGHGLCPLEWIEDAGRAFGGKPHSPRRVPHSVDAVLAMVSDPSGLVEAETLAREAHHRAARWSRYVVPQSLVYWKVARESLAQKGVRTANQSLVPLIVPSFSIYSVDERVWQQAMAKVELASFPYEPSRGWFARLARRLTGEGSYESQKCTYWRGEWAKALADARWSTAMRQAVEDHQQAWAYALFCEAGLRLSDVVPEGLRTAIDRERHDVLLSSLPNVFEPLAQLWWTGYATHYMNFGQIELHLPPLALE